MTAKILQFPYNARSLHRGTVVDAGTPAEIIPLPVVPVQRSPQLVDVVGVDADGNLFWSKTWV